MNLLNVKCTLSAKTQPEQNMQPESLDQVSQQGRCRNSRVRPCSPLCWQAAIVTNLQFRMRTCSHYQSGWYFYYVGHLYPSYDVGKTHFCCGFSWHADHGSWQRREIGSCQVELWRLRFSGFHQGGRPLRVSLQQNDNVS